MKKIFNIKIYTMVIAILAFTSCEENFLDINDDPNNPLSVPTAQLITAAETNVGYTFSNGSGGLGLYTGTVVKHWVQRGPINDYGLQGTDFTVTTAWQSLYAGALTDTQVAIEQGTASEDFGSVGIAQLLRVLIISTAVDLWGDVPYSEIGLGAANEAPVYEDGSGIYTELLALIDTAIGNLNNGTTNVAGDLIYGGDRSKWVTMANSLKLRLLNNIRLTRDVSSEVATALSAGVITSAADDFELTYGTSFNPENRNPGFSFEWTAGNSTKIDPYFFETMRSQDTFGHGGLQLGAQDPRVPYYFFNQLPAGSGDADAENPCAYCPSDAGTSFLSLYSYSFNIDPNEGFDQGRSQTLAGLYPIGGRFDDGAGGIASNASTLAAGQVTGPGNTAQRLLDLGEVLFIRAELAQANVTGENARTLLGQAIDASFAKVNAVATTAGAPTIAAADVTAYRDAVLATYDGAADPMEVVMTSKWVAQFGNSLVSYNDIRRTGYPRLHDGNTDNLSVTVQTRQFPVSLPYDITNGSLNSSFPGQRVIASDRVFWDVN